MPRPRAPGERAADLLIRLAHQNGDVAAFLRGLHDHEREQLSTDLGRLLVDEVENAGARERLTLDGLVEAGEAF